MLGDLHALDAVAMRWADLSNLTGGAPPPPRYGHGMAASGGAFYVFGGYGGQAFFDGGYDGSQGPGASPGAPPLHSPGVLRSSVRCCLRRDKNIPLIARRTVGHGLDACDRPVTKFGSNPRARCSQTLSLPPISLSALRLWG